VSIRILQSSAECNDQMAPSEWADSHGVLRGSTRFFAVLLGSSCITEVAGSRNLRLN